MRHLILIVAIWWFGSPVESAEINVNAPDSHGRIFVDIVGQIAANDDKAFEQKTAIHTRYNKVIVTLSGPGGVALTAMKIGERIHTNGWGTYVPSGAVCASSCAIIWLAGVPRTIEGAPGVIIGFHAVYDIETQKESGAANAILGHYLTRWGLDDHGIHAETRLGVNGRRLVRIGFAPLRKRNHFVLRLQRVDGFVVRLAAIGVCTAQDHAPRSAPGLLGRSWLPAP
jgi:hypothetical protein